jgi:hypothetical protein
MGTLVRRNRELAPEGLAIDGGAVRWREEQHPQQCQRG